MHALPGPPADRPPVLVGIVLAWRDWRWIAVPVADHTGTPTVDHRSSAAHRPANPWRS